MTEVEKAWLAGFVDGEGCITVARSYAKHMNGRPSFSRLFTITNTAKAPIEFIVSHFGGRIRTIQLPGNRKLQYQISYRPSKCCKLLRDIIPYLVVKREVAELVLNFPHRNRGFHKLDAVQLAKQEAVFERIQQLNKRGMK